MPEYHFHVLAVFDLLGQSELLDALTDEFVLDCITKGKKEHLIERMKPTFGRVNRFREHLKKVVGDINHPIPMPQQLQGKVTEQTWKRLTQAQVGIEFMGDSALLKISINNELGSPLPVVSIRDLMSGISMQMLAFLGGGIPIRGAVELGWGTHIEENSIYGTMLHRAIRLEKEAGYPRVMIGQNFLNYLQPLVSHPQDGVPQEDTKIIMKTAKEVMGLIIEDDDGEIVLNYLQKDLYSASEEPYNQSVTLAKDFIQSEIAKYRQTREKKLLGKYCKLRRFFHKNNQW